MDLMLLKNTRQLFYRNPSFGVCVMFPCDEIQVMGLGKNTTEGWPVPCIISGVHDFGVCYW